jgi:hypothetical protein
MLNWYFGWAMMLSAFVTGAGLGLFFYRDDFLGGYQSFRRRILRLGHIALAALGMVNVLYAVAAPEAVAGARAASLGFVIGGVAMPAVCFLTAWRVGFRYLFFIPVVALVVAVVEVLRIGPP